MKRPRILYWVPALGLFILSGCLLTAQRTSSGDGTTTQLVNRATQSAQSRGERGAGVPEFWVRPGYRVELVSENLRDARFVEIDNKGTLYLSRPNSGDILTLKLRNGKYERVAAFVSGYPTVHGMQFADGWLWFAQTGAIHKARDTNGDGKADQIETVIPEGQLPKGGGHWWRAILITKDSIYTSIGDSGNISDETKTERQKIWRFNKDGSNKRLFASGIRNNEKLRLRPGTNEIWGMDHGSDWYGARIGDKQGRQPVTDMHPPEEFNHYVQDGFYGHPFITGFKLPRIEYHNRDDIIDLAEKTIVPEWGFGAHWAGNGFTFLTKNYFPDHAGDAFVAFHGSWNRREPAGYRVERVLFDDVTGKPYGNLMVVGTLVNGRVLARPVDCAELPDGSILFSCDQTGRIYRITRAQKGKTVQNP